MEKVIEALIIEAKQGAYEMVTTYMRNYAQALKEAVYEPGLDDNDKRVISAKEDLIWEMMDELSAEHESHIEEVKHRYKDYKCSDISTDYLQNLKGWTLSG